MDTKFGHVKNPLSIIAIFAGLVEVSGTFVLPHIEKETQGTFIWFLMTFPFFLVFLFFATLLFKHKVLYAPSDFQNEDNFMEAARPAKFSHVKEKREQEIQDAQETSGTELPHSKQEETSSPTLAANKAPESSLQNISIQKYELLESFIISNYQTDTQAPILRNVKLPGGTDYIFDGIAFDEKSTSFFEVKLVKNTTRSDVFTNWARDLSEAVRDAKKNNSLIGDQLLFLSFVNVDGDTSDEKQSEIIRAFKNAFKGVSLTFSFIPLDSIEKKLEFRFDQEIPKDEF
ncbi:hypothetical protein NBH20_09600 [Rhizobium sp. S153]|uniref:Uncharacterized protein n=1 Tax=Ciceribacter sichuanensis TaxID=2949647 RepID=A0ABT0VA35_9HYPH|nr:hypothetical protein [Ciceribacter sp. S153]MCM2401410.1 hypothetical protein [Ciceribacter sp. S153]